MRTYTELSQIESFKDRFEYLKCLGTVGEETFGYDRYLNQYFYSTTLWRKIRDEVILRDKACDLGVPGYELNERIYIHHINPITKIDIINRTDALTSPEFLICTSYETHYAIHYGDINVVPKQFTQRQIGDTCPWKHI